MRAAGEILAGSIRTIPARPASTTVYSPILQREYTADDDLPALLASHLTLPVRFDLAVRDLHARGARNFVECGARNTLSKATSAALGDRPHTALPSLPDGARGIAAATAALRAAGLFSSGPQVTTGDSFDAFWAAKGEEIIARLRAEFLANAAAPVEVTVGETVAAPVFVAAPGTLPTEVPAPAVDRDDVAPGDVAGRLRELYATALEYPVEVFTDEVELEAELGIDSVKQLELLTRISEEYGIQLQDDDFRLADYDTMGKVVEYTVRRLAEREPAHV
jgi:acyl carrier protein